VNNSTTNWQTRLYGQTPNYWNNFLGPYSTVPVPYRYKQTCWIFQPYLEPLMSQTFCPKPKSGTYNFCGSKTVDLVNVFQKIHQIHSFWATEMVCTTFWWNTKFMAHWWDWVWLYCMDIHVWHRPTCTVWPYVWHCCMTIWA
jgi:hypothetical protein